MQAAPSSIALFIAACLFASHLASSQVRAAESAATPTTIADAASSLPDAPIPPLETADASSAALPQSLASPYSSTHVSSGGSSMPPGTSLTLRDRFGLELRTSFGVPAFLLPAFESTITMAHPPDHFPQEWRDGGAGFGRNYAAYFARHGAGGLTHFAVADIVREDPRYHPSASTNPAFRFVHALAFTIVDKSDSGRNTLAVANLSGSLVGGFIGETFYPYGFNDPTHSLQRSLLELGNFGAHNLTAEFAPELARLAHKFHFPDRVADSFLPPDRK